MKINKILKFLQCPYCTNNDLLLKPKRIVCASCQTSFSIIDGIPILIKKKKLNEQEQKQQKKFNKLYCQFPNKYKLENWRLSMLTRIFQTSFKTQVKTYLDIGCGATGYTVIEAAKRNNWLSLGLDISLEAILKAKALAKKEGVEKKTAFLVGSAEHLPLKNNLFDYVSAASVLEHLANDQQLIKDVYRVLKKDGYFYICVPNTYKKMGLFWRPIYRHIDHKVGHQRHYSINDLNKKMGSNNFTLEKCFYNGHLVKLGQIILDKLHLLNDKQWWQLESKDINQNSKGLQLNAIYQKGKRL